MKKTAAILAFTLGVGFICTWLFMVRDDGKNAAADITEGFRLSREGDNAAFDRFIQDSKDRKSEERDYGLIGAVGIIAGFALWPRETPVGPSNPVAQ
jgi:hypothetical protein